MTKTEKALIAKKVRLQMYERKIRQGFWRREAVSALMRRLQIQIDFFTLELNKARV